MAEQPRSFADLVDWQKAAAQQDPFFGGLSLPEFSQLVEQEYGPGTAQAGMKDNALMRASGAIDRFLRPISRETAPAGRAVVSKFFGEEHANLGERLGRELPRGAAQALGAFGAWPVAVPAVLSAGAQAYTETGGNPIAGLIGAATTGTMRPVAALGHTKITLPLVERLADSTLKGTGARNALRSFLQRGAETLGPNVTLAVQGELAAQGTALAVTGRPFNPFTEEHLIEQTASQLPFAAFDAARLLNFRNPAVTESQVLAQRVAGRVKETIKQDIETFHKTAATKKTEPAVVAPPKDTVVPKAPIPPTPESKNPLTGAAYVDIGQGVKMRADLLNPYTKWTKHMDMPKNAKVPWELPTIMKEAGVSQADAEIIYDMGMQRGLISAEGVPLKLIAGEADMLDMITWKRRKKDDDQMDLPMSGEKTSAENWGQLPTGEVDEFGLPVMKPITHMPLVSSLVPFRATFLPHMRVIREIMDMMPNDVTRGAYLKGVAAEAPTKGLYEQAEGKQPIKKVQGEVPPIIDETAGRSRLDMSDPTKWDVSLFMEAEKNLPPAVAPPAQEGVAGATTMGGKPLPQTIVPKGTTGVDVGALQSKTLKGENPEFAAALKLRKLITGERNVSDLIAALEDPIVQEALIPILLERGINTIDVPFRSYSYVPAGELHQVSLGLMPERLATDQLLQQIVEAAGKGGPTEMLGRGPVETMSQMGRIYKNMTSMVNEALAGHSTKPLEFWMKGLEEFSNTMLAKGHSPEVVAERMYQRMMWEVREKMEPIIEAAQGRALEDSLRKVKKFIEKVPEKDRARALREIYKTEREMVLAKLARLSELERPLSNGVVLLDDLVGHVIQPARPHLGPEHAFPQTRAWIHDLEKRYGTIVDPMSRIYAAAVDFYDTWETQVRIYRGKPGREAQIARDGMTDEQVVRAAFRGYIETAGKLAGSEQAKSYFRTMEGLAERYGIDPAEVRARAVPDEQSGKQHRLMTVSEEQLSADAEAKAQDVAMRSFLKENVPGKFTHELWMAMHEAAGLKKARSTHGYVRARRYERLLTMVHDGVFGFRLPKFTKGGKGDANEGLEMFVREEAGIRLEDIRDQLGFTDADLKGTRQFIREEFLPTLKQLIKTAGEDPDRVLKYGREVTSAEEAAPVLPERPTVAGDMGSVEPAFRTMDTLAIQARTFFTEKFSGMGYDEAQTQIVVDLATKMAYSFQAVAFANMTGIDSLGIMGLSRTKWVDDRFASLVGVNFSAIENTFGKKLAPFKALWTLGHELAHTLINTADEGGAIVGRDHAVALKRWAEDLNPQVRGVLIDDLFRLIIPQAVMEAQPAVMLEMLQKRRAEAVRNHEEFLADFISLHAAAHISPYKGEMSARLAATVDYNVAFFKGMFANLFDITDSVKQFLQVSMDDAFDSRTTRGTHKAGLLAVEQVSEMQKHVKHVLADLKQVEDSFAALQRIESMEPERFAEMAATAVTPKLQELSTQNWWAASPDSIYRTNFERDQSTLDAVQTAMGLKNHAEMEKAYGLVQRFHHKWFFPMAQLASRFPILWPAARVVYNFRADVNSLLEGFLAPFMATTRSGRLALDIKGKGLSTALQNPEVNRAVTWMALRKNEVMDANPSSAGLINEPQMHRMLEARFPGMSVENRRVVVDMHKNLEKIMPQVGMEYVKSQKTSVKNLTAMAMQRLNKGLSPAALYKTADRLVDIVYLLEDPNQTPTGQARRAAGDIQFRTDFAGADPELLRAGLEMAKGLIKTVYDMEELYGTNVGAIPNQFEGRNGAFPRTGYTPEVRKGRHSVTWGDDEGHSGALNFEDVRLANEYAAELRAQGKRVRQQDTQDKASLLDGMGPKVAQAFARREQEAYKAFVERIRETQGDEIADLLANHDVGSLVLKDVASRSIGKYKLPRKLREGREGINTMENVIDYLFASATALAKRNAKESMALHLSAPEMTGNPKLRSQMRDHLLTVVDPPTREWTALKNTNFLMYMAGNFSTMMVELSQSFMTLAPSLTEQVLNGRQTGVLDSYKYIGKALDTWVGIWRKKGVIHDADLNRAITHARERGILDFGIMQEFHPDMDSAYLNLRNLISGSNKRWAGYEIFTKPLTWVMHTSRWLYSQFPKFNTHLAYVAAYKLAKDRGYSGQQAEGFAEQIVLTSNFGGGPAGRPGLFANNGKLHGAVGAMYSLQTYLFGQTAMLCRMAEVSIGGAKGFTPGEKQAARRAFAQALVTQLSAAGALGLPLADGLVSLVEQFFPVNLRKWLREQAVAAGSWVTQDDEMGQVFGDMAMRGVVNKAFEAADVPIDVGSRLSLGQGMGLDSYSGFGLKNVIGPIGGVFESVGRGVQKAAAGEWGEGAEMMVPRAVQKALRLHNDQYTFRDSSGRLLYQPDTLEMVAYGLGFQPKKLKEHQEAAQMTRQSEKVWAGQMQKFHNRLADMVEQGDTEGARLALLKMEQEHPESYNARAGAGNVAELVRKRNTPLDLLDEGTRMGAGSRAEVMRMLSQRTITPEVQRIQVQKQIEAALGVPRAALVSRTEMRMATMIDQLVAQNPLLSHQMARAIVEKAMTRRRQPSLVAPR